MAVVAEWLKVSEAAMAPNLAAAGLRDDISDRRAQQGASWDSP
jgi:hypothetical protein